MNYWIQSKRDALLELLKRVDILMVNDSEARELSGDWNIHRAGRWILAQGPERVVIKQGEHGALLIEPAADLLRAGVSAGGSLRSHRRGRRLRRRIHGLPRPHRRRSSDDDSAARWSTAPRWAPSPSPQFGIRGFDGVTLARRASSGSARSSDLTHVELAGADRVTERQYAAAGVDLDSAEAAKERIGQLVAGTRTALSRRARSAPSAAWCGCRPGCSSRCWC